MTIVPIGHTLGYTVGFPLTIAFSVLFLCFALGGLAYRLMGAGEDSYFAPDYFGAYSVIVLGVIGLLGTLIISGVSFWPWHADYHTRYRVHGQVTAVNSRLISDSNHAVSQRYVFTIGNTPFGVDDTRASLTKPGDTVTLICTKEYTYGAAFGWACAWGQEP